MSEPEASAVDAAGSSTRRPLLVSKGWLQATVLVFLFGFLVLGLLAYSSYASDPPIPDRATDPAGRTLFTGDDVRAGQKVFLDNGLMEYGSIFGHGAYLGPDYTADYLHRAALAVRRRYGGASSDRARQQTVADFDGNRYSPANNTLTYTAAQAAAFHRLEGYYHRRFANPTTRFGLRANAITSRTKTDDLTAFFSWSAWAA
jgi:nitric oxide reductase subunit B